MRSDYGLYLIAIICFLVTGVALTNVFPAYLPDPMSAGGVTVWIVFLVLGIIFVIIGYSVRPKITMPAPSPAPPAPVVPEAPVAQEVPEVPPPKLEPTIPIEAPPMVEEIPPPVPSTALPAEAAPTAPTPEEPAEIEGEEKPKEKPVRRRRRKTA